MGIHAHAYWLAKYGAELLTRRKALRPFGYLAESMRRTARDLVSEVEKARKASPMLTEQGLGELLTDAGQRFAHISEVTDADVAFAREVKSHVDRLIAHRRSKLHANRRTGWR